MNNAKTPRKRYDEGFKRSAVELWLQGGKSAGTNLTAKVIFNRLILEGGKSVDPTRNVQIKPASK